jgi:thiamine phosphate synthase YjbQ (UPF0047 family)
MLSVMGDAMKSHTKYLTFNVPARMDFVHITPQVQESVAESGVREGLCLVNAMHITASVFINDNERGLHEDYKRWLEELAPQIMGREVVIAITDGRLDLGPWEAIFYGEFDGRRPKRVLIKIIGD